MIECLDTLYNYRVKDLQGMTFLEVQSVYKEFAELDPDTLGGYYD